jgi:dihydroorotase-like cyclic amidohydrolase
MSRQIIRNAVSDLLTAAMSEVLNEISIGRRDAIPLAKLPAVSIFTDAESAEIIDLTPPRTYERTLDLNIRIMVHQEMAFVWDDLAAWDDSGTWLETQSENIEDKLDAIASSIESILSASQNLGIANVADLYYTGFSVEGDEDKTEADLLAGTLAFNVIYHTVETI